MNGLEALKRIRQETAPNTYCKDFDKEECCNTIEKELKDYHEIKEIAKRNHWDDLVKATHRTDTEEKYRLLFNSAICYIQADYRKARAFEIIKAKNVNVGMLKRSESVGSYHYKMDELRDKCKPLTQDEFDLLKEVLK